MALNPTQAAYLADLLTGLGSGLMSAPRGGPPLAGFSAGIGNANQLMAQRRQMADQDAERQFRAQQMQRQTEADAEAKRLRAKAGSLLIGQPAPTGTGAREGGAVPGSPGLISQLPAQYQPFASAYAQVNPEGALQWAGEQLTKTPTSPDLTEFSTPDGRAYKGYLDPNTKQPVRVGDFYPRWQPPQPKGPSELQERARLAGLLPGTPEYRNFMLTGGSTPKQPGILMLYGPNGERKSVYENDPAVPGMLQSNWTTEAPKAAEIPGTMSLTKDGKTITINENDPQRGMYLASGWIDAGVAPKPMAGPVITGEAAKAVGLDPARSWQQKPDGTWGEIMPKETDVAWKIVTDPATGKELYQENNKGERKPLPGQESGGAFKQENTLRDEFNALTKDFRIVQDAYNKINATSNTGQGDMSMLYSYVKLLDPGSVVRESEFELAAQTGSLPQQVQGWASRLLNGEKLPDEVREQFRAEAKSIFEAQKAGYDKQVDNYTNLAKQAGINPTNVIVPYDVQFTPNPAPAAVFKKYDLVPPPGAPQ